MEAITFFIYAFASIFVIVNPVAGLIIFISLTSRSASALTGFLVHFRGSNIREMTLSDFSRMHVKH